MKYFTFFLFLNFLEIFLLLSLFNFYLIIHYYILLPDSYLDVNDNDRLSECLFIIVFEFFLDGLSYNIKIKITLTN